MTSREKLYLGTSRAAWGYLFLYFDVNLGTINLLPNAAGYFLLLSAIRFLEEERRDLSLLRPLGMFLAAWYGADWVMSLWGSSLNGLIPALQLLVVVVGLYFHFQLFTDFAALAHLYKGPGDTLDRQLLICRTVQTLLQTALIAMTYLSQWMREVWDYVSIVLMLVDVIIGLCLMMTLFELRKRFRDSNSEILPS